MACPFAVSTSAFGFSCTDSYQDQFAAMRDMYIQRGDGFILVYSVSSEQSIDRCEELYKQISRLNEEREVSFAPRRALCSTLATSQALAREEPH